MAKHKLNYTIIREALGEYLKNKAVIPMYNKKQIKEEAYKLEDLENSKAFLIDNAPRKRMRVDLNITKQILFETLEGFLRQEQTPKYFTSGASYSTVNNQKYETIETYLQLYKEADLNTRVENMIWVIENLLSCGNLRANITKDQKERLVIATENLPKHE
jgi:hypothetical protein|tara:strand:+ start:3442 stop:3921 length:480 start_codon:yes stop_codon:yes gene_type:complete